MTHFDVEVEMADALKDKTRIVGERLREGGISRVLIIDDAFDNPSEDDVAAEIGDFLAAVQAAPTVKQQVLECIGADEIPTTLAAEPVARLWRLFQDSQDARPVLGTLFAKKLIELSSVEPICRNLEMLFGNANVATAGANESLPTGDIDVVFLDYRLGTSNDHDAVARAKASAVELTENEAEKDVNTSVAFVILMSGKVVTENQWAEFRESSGLHRSLFEFASKNDLAETNKLMNRLVGLVGTLSTRRSVHKLATELSSTLASTSKQLKSAVKTLGIEDIAYLQRTALRRDGHPLGDYLVWLFAEYAAHLISSQDTLRTSRNDLNRVKFDNLVPMRRRPSVELAKMYRAAITEVIHEGWAPHPHEQPSDSGDSSDHLLPRLEFGYLLTQPNGRDIFMVLNAACDLAMAPGENRKSDPAQSILLLPGRLIPLEKQPDATSDGACIELFEADGKRFRIIWQYQNVISVRHDEIRAQYATDYRPTGRLRGTYAVEIQQSFAKRLTRIGQPETPPVFGGELPIRAYYKGVDGKPVHLGDFDDPGVFLFHHKQKQMYVLSQACTEWLYDRIVETCSQLRETNVDIGGDSSLLESLDRLASVLLPDCKFQFTETAVPKKGSVAEWPEKTSKKDKANPLLAIHHTDGMGANWEGPGIVAICFSVAPMTEERDEDTEDVDNNGEQDG